MIPRMRLDHMIGVAKFMHKNAEKFGLDPDQMYVLGLLHDVGYLKGKEGHEEYGVKLIEQLFGDFNRAGNDILRWHGTSPQDFIENHKDIYGHVETPELAMEPELVLLWLADMVVDSYGDVVGFASRLADVEHSQGEDSEGYKICKDTIEWLKTNVKWYTRRKK